MSESPDRAGYSIAAVSKLTGVSCHALRVWERRYGFPAPERSPAGHRRYCPDQVSLLGQLATLARSGRSIGELIGDYQAGELDLRRPVGAKGDERPVSAEVVDRLTSGDMVAADRLLDQLAEVLSPMELMLQVIEPALIEVGERWFRGECDIFQERSAVSRLFVLLGRLTDQARRANLDPTRSVLVGTVQGDRHEGGVLLLGLALELAGWRAISLGVDLPIGEFQKAIEAWHPDALGVSFVLSRNINKRFQALAKIREVPVFVGGRSITNHQGLARRYGLIPLTGTLAACSATLRSEVESWRRQQGPGPAS